MKYFHKSFVPVFLIVGFMAGCGQATTEKKCDGAISTRKEVSFTNLPPLGDYLPVTDAGRIEVAPPEGWIVKSGGRRHLERFYKQENSDIPRITIESRISFYDEIETVDNNNLEQFARLISQDLKDNQTKIIERVRPMTLGGKPWVRYVRFRSAKHEVEKQILKTLFEGKIYTIELWIPAGEILESRDNAYAVAAGVNFIASRPDAAP